MLSGKLGVGFDQELRNRVLVAYFLRGVERLDRLLPAIRLESRLAGCEIVAKLNRLRTPIYGFQCAFVIDPHRQDTAVFGQRPFQIVLLFSVAGNCQDSFGFVD